MSDIDKDPSVNPGVTYTIKELLRNMDVKLDRIENNLASKADKALVDVLAQKIEGMRISLPSAELLREHAQLVTQEEVNKLHNKWVDDQIKELHDWREATVSLKQMIVPIIALIFTVIWTVFSIINMLASKGPLN